MNHNRNNTQSFLKCIVTLLVLVALKVLSLSSALLPINEAHATTSTVYVDDDYTELGTNDGHTWSVDAFATIQNGINAVAVSGTVNVAAGTYTENITINKTLTLIGDIGNGSVGVGASAPDVLTASNTRTINVTANDVIIEGFIVENNGGSPAIRIAPGKSGALIQNNDLRNGFSTMDLSPTSHNNIVTKNKLNNGPYVGIAVNGSTNNIISYNEVYNLKVGIMIASGGGPNGGTGRVYTVGGNTISHNNIHDISDGSFSFYGEGILFFDNLDTSAGPITIDSNTITANYKSGIYMDPGNTISNLIITNNTITGNNTTNTAGNGGIIIESALNNSAHNNIISGNIGAGVINNDATNDFNATGNFWGDASGPYNASTNPSGTGDAVSDKVIYDPFWRSSPVADTVFANDATVSPGDTATVVSSGDADNQIWFAPADTTSFVAGPTMTTTTGDATSILAPATAGDYQLFVIDSVGNISKPSAATLSVLSPTPTPTPTPTPSTRGSSGGGSGFLATPTPTPSPSPDPTSSPQATPQASISVYNLTEGDRISSGVEVYIVNDYGYKRSVITSLIFQMYGHLSRGFEDVHALSPAIPSQFPTSNLYRNCETNDLKVYALEMTGPDTGILHWVNMTADQAISQDSQFFHKVFCVNTLEFSSYPKSASDYTDLSQLPVYP